MKPLIISKINTALQLLLLVLVLAAEAFSLSADLVRNVLIYLVAATTFGSGIIYVFSWTKMASEMEKSGNQTRGDP